MTQAPQSPRTVLATLLTLLTSTLAATPAALRTFVSRVPSWVRAGLADMRAAWAYTYVRHGFWGMLLITAGAFTPAFLPPDSRLLTLLGMAAVGDGAARVVATGAIVGGIGLLLHAWLRLRPRAGQGALPTATWFVWSLPALVAPPLFSRDAYSYAAQGLIVDRGMDPYTTAPISVPGGFADQVDAMWLYTPAPYGPLALQLQHLIVDLSFGNAYIASLAMRAPAVVSVAVIAFVLPRLAARLGVSPAGALWLGVLNPLVLLHLVGGAHNDAMMLALVVVGLYLAADGRLAWGALSVAAAAGFKQTAVLALIGVAGLAARRLPGGFWAYLKVAVRTGLIAFAGFVALTLASGLGWGWIPNLSVPMALTSFLAPATLIGSAVGGVLSLLGADPEVVARALPVVRGIAAALAVGTVLWCTFVLARRRPMSATVIAFAALVLGGPVLQPWYTLPVFALLPLVRPSRRAVQIAVWVVVFLVGYSAFDVGMGNGVWVVGVALMVWAVLRMKRSRTDVVDEAFDAPLDPAASEVAAAEPAAALPAPGPSANGTQPSDEQPARESAAPGTTAPRRVTSA